MRTRISRRQVLRGAAGFTLALPLLPSLLPRQASAGGAGPGRRRFVALCTEHGGVWGASMFPGDGSLTDDQAYAGRTIRRGDLVATAQGDDAVLSPVLRAPSAALTPALVAKLNVLRGLDHTFYIGHHRGGHLGNYAENDGNGSDGQVVQAYPRPTIDQVLAWSEHFYPDLSSILERSLIVGEKISWGWSSPATQSGAVQQLPPEWSSLALFHRIFVPEEDLASPRPPVVDRVMESYLSLRQSDRRLSAGDRQRLDEHLERLDELQRRLEVTVSCGDVPVPRADSQAEWGSSSYGFDPAAHGRFWQLFNDVIVAAFMCDTSRIAVMRITDTFSDYAGDWHNDIAHEAHTPDGGAQAVLAAAHQRFFEDVFVDLAAKLDAVTETEGTALDSTLLQWTQESGCVTHDPIELPVVTAGSAGGFFKTGQYVDYRNLQKQAHTPSADNAVTSHTGLIYNQWLGTVLQSMGLEPSEYEDGVNGGYGKTMMSTESWWAGYQSYGSDETSVMGEVLPLLKA
jgi:hypothetical protein